MSMRPLNLDFIKHTPPSNMGMALLLLGALILSGSLWYWAQLLRDSSTLNLQLQAQKSVEAQRLKAKNIQEASKKTVSSSQLVTLNTLKPKRWSTLLNHLESSMTDEVALLSIEPNAQTGQLQLVAQAKDYPAILTYMTRLDESTALQDIHLLKHEVELETAGQPVYFILSATWYKKS